MIRFAGGPDVMAPDRVTWELAGVDGFDRCGGSVKRNASNRERVFTASMGTSIVQL